jgi:hypothetical protein
MKRIQTFLAVLLLALMSVGAQAQAQRADDLDIGEPASAQERPQRQERGARGGVPTLREVNQTARDGDLAKARTMIDQVLQRQPDNARAHFVKAQLAARDRDLATARAELQAAEQLAPGLPFAREQAVTNLRKRLERLEAREGRGGPRRAGRNARDDTTARPAEAPAESPASPATDAGSTPTAGNTTAPVETRTAGEDTRSMGSTTAAAADKGNTTLVMGVAIGAVIAAALTALFFRRRRPPQA